MNENRDENAVDVAIIGGSNAGLSAALTLGRSRRRVVVLDDSHPRNAPADHTHNFYTQDGTPPDELRRIGREQLAPYDVHFLNTRVSRAGGSKGRFHLELTDGSTLLASRLLLATGVSDDLPPIPGLRDVWGTSAFTCPYCHGWEVRDTPLAVLGGSAFDYDYARFIQNWSDDLVLISSESMHLTDAQRTDLETRGIRVIESHVTEFERQGRKLIALRLSDGQRLTRNAVFVHPPTSLRGDLHEQLGCALNPEGSLLKINDMGETSVPGIYAAGDIVTMASIVMAAASGTRAAAALNHEFILAK